MFPEIASRLKGLFDGFGSKPVPLDLKTGGFSFDAVNVGWYARNGYPALYSIAECEIETTLPNRDLPDENICDVEFA